MADLMRVSFTIERGLYEELENLLATTQYKNRSEFIRDLVRERLVRDSWRRNEEAVGTITMVYDHHQRDLSNTITHVQHERHDAILATTHVHLTHDLCVEMIMVRGPAEQIESLADELRSHKGVLHAAVSMSSTGKRLR
ncbi:MAG TPA: nickel-responsive transcriptional regulator NikR [Candidatus Hydrogenedentes bacterium]|nr:nickel-responsive transcriptional regulator NikR [Candidatus Hydrogenedentota bacterium]